MGNLTTAHKCLIYFRDNGVSPGSRTNPGEKASNSELRRWLENGSVNINGICPSPDELVKFPVDKLVWFPGKKQITSY